MLCIIRQDLIIFSEVGLEFSKMILIHNKEDCNFRSQPKKQTLHLVGKFGSYHLFIVIFKELVEMRGDFA